jgi:hypothetical protein
MGSFSTGRVAIRAGASFVGFEISKPVFEHYVAGPIMREGDLCLPFEFPQERTPNALGLPGRRKSARYWQNVSMR